MEAELKDNDFSRAGVRPEERRRRKKRGIVLATGGLVFALAVGLLFDLVGVAEVSLEWWVALLLATLGVQGALWLVPHRGLDERLAWDPHYIYVPMFAAALLLGSYVYLVPAARYLILMGWFVALLFTAGLAGMKGTVLLGAAMTASYLAAVGLHATGAGRLNYSVELIQAAVFFGINVFGGVVAERLRRDRAKMKELREELAERAVTDALTGLRNRRYFEEFLQAELARLRRYGGECAVAMIDVDAFKNYNDSLGHMAGDDILRRLADLFNDRLRLSDVVARYGGEEFGVIMVNTARQDAVDVIERLREYVEHHPFEGEEVQPLGRLTISAGVAGAPEDGETYEELMKRADEALYGAKRRGKNRVQLAA